MWDTSGISVVFNGIGHEYEEHLNFLINLDTSKEEMWAKLSKKQTMILYPSEMVTWHPIEWGLENGYHTFDFGSAGKPDEEYGVREFKKQFGGELVNCG